MKKSDKTIVAILEATDKLLKIKGITKVNYNDIAKESGISRPTIYDYFKNLDQIIYSILIRNHKKNSVIQVHGSSIQVIIEELSNELIDQLKNNYHLNLYIFQSGQSMDDKFRKIILDYNAWIYSKFFEELKRFNIPELELKINLFIAGISKEFGDYYLTKDENKLKTTIQNYAIFIFRDK